MTTPRIEEFLKEVEGIGDYLGTNTPELLNEMLPILTAAHQAGVDEAVEVVKSMKKSRNMEVAESLYEMNIRTLYNQALDDTIKALQDNK